MSPLSLSQTLSAGQTQRQVQTLQTRQLQNLALLQSTRAELSQLLRQAADLNPALVVEDPSTVSLDAAREDWDREGAGPDADADGGETDADFGVLAELGSDADELYSDGTSYTRLVSDARKKSSVVDLARLTPSSLSFLTLVPSPEKK